MTTEELAKLEHHIYNAIRDLNLIQAEPIPEGAVPVVVYVGVANVGDKTLVKCEAIDSWQDDDKCQLNAFDDDNTHRVRLEGYALPVAVPTMKAISREIK